MVCIIYITQALEGILMLGAISTICIIFIVKAFVFYEQLLWSLLFIFKAVCKFSAFYTVCIICIVYKLFICSDNIIVKI
jgi:hypothetical protein